MVSLSSQEEAAANVPVELSPQPPGKWRWLGTRTLVFEPTGRFPMATQYSVTVPAGTKSTGGGTLANPKTWTFTTPPPTIVQSYPGKEHTQARDTLMFIAFDQRIDPAAMMNSIQVRSGLTVLPARLATKEEIAANAEVKQLVEATQNDRWLAFRVINPQTGETKLALPAESIDARLVPEQKGCQFLRNRPEQVAPKLKVLTVYALCISTTSRRFTRVSTFVSKTYR